MFGGVPLWKGAWQKIADQEKLDKIQKLKDNFMKRKLAKLDAEYERLLEYYKEKVAIYNKKYYKRQKVVRDNMKYIRGIKRRASDGQIGIKRHYDPYYETM